MQFHEATERDLNLILMVADGVSLKDAAQPHGLTAERVRQIVIKFCRSYLEYAKADGSPEKFYPGPSLISNQFYPSLPKSDITTRDFNNWCRSVDKGLVPVDVAGEYNVEGIDSIDDLRQYKDYWIHQITLLRRERHRRSKKK
jgi:hypothetical protein